MEAYPMSETTLSKWEQAISRLVEFTQDGKLKWKLVNPEDYLPKADTSGAMLMVKYSQMYLLLYQDAYTYISGGFLATMSGTGTPTKSYHPVLSVYDVGTKTTVYTFPDSKLVGDLYKAATYSAASVDELISKILEEASKKKRA
jgi:hypothetical protein